MFGAIGDSANVCFCFFYFVLSFLLNGRKNDLSTSTRLHLQYFMQYFLFFFFYWKSHLRRAIILWSFFHCCWEFWHICTFSKKLNAFACVELCWCRRGCRHCRGICQQHNNGLFGFVVGDFRLCGKSVKSISTHSICVLFYKRIIVCRDCILSIGRIFDYL